MQVNATWVNALAFDLTSPDSTHTVRLDASKESGGTDTGLNPKKLLLGSLCGCSGIDVVDILKKMKVSFQRIEIEASAEQTDETPKTFRFIHMIYRTDAAPEDADKVARAVSLSHEKYCGISAMLAKHCPITYEIAGF
ncbi:MAG: OsmC family protein [Bacteroidota bacterium]